MSVVTGFSLVGSNGLGSTSNTLNGTIPATAEEGDIVVIGIQSTESTPTVTSAPGWTLIRGPADLTGTSTAYAYAREVTASGTGGPGWAFSIGWSETRRLSGAGVVLRGSTLAGVISNELIDSVSTSNASIALLNNVPAGSDLVAFTLLRRGGTVATDITTWPAAWTIEVEAKTTFSNLPNLTTGAFYQAAGAAGTYGGGTVDTNNANLAISFTIAFPPAAPATLNKFKLGSGAVDKIYYGSAEIQKLYLGSTQIWP